MKRWNYFDALEDARIEGFIWGIVFLGSAVLIVVWLLSLWR